jgi:glycosyltransferase involved in cell wall biosynthesis
MVGYKYPKLIERTLICVFLNKILYKINLKFKRTQSVLMNIIVITNEPFPIGMAATNRIASYSKGIVELGNKLKVFCLRPLEKETNVFNKFAKGIYNKIEYEYTSGTTIWPNNKVKKIYVVIKGLFNAIIRIRQENKIDCVIIVVNAVIPILLFYFLTRILKIKYVQEKSEYPFVLRNKTFTGKIYSYFYIKFIYKLFDGMILMTNNLQEYFKDKVNYKAKIVLVPMTVEFERFDIKRSENVEKYIAYCGDMGGNKDGVDILIDSYYQFSKKFHDIKLYLIGDTSRQLEIQKLKQKVSELSLKDKVIFTGRIHKDEIPKYLCNALFLVLARPSSLQSDGGFPTKLGEYLSTGNPVVVTKVGEISKYLTDNENAFLVEPDDKNGFARKMEFVIDNKDIANKVGLEGREVVLKKFNYKLQAEKIIEFIQKL